MTPRLKCALGGLVLVVMGPLLLKWSVLDVLEQARAHAAEVSFSEKSIFFAPLSFFGGVAGLVMAAMPSVWVGFVPYQQRRFSDLSPAHEALVVAFVMLVLGAGFALRSWFVSELLELGYEV